MIDYFLCGLSSSDVIVLSAVFRTLYYITLILISITPRVYIHKGLLKIILWCHVILIFLQPLLDGRYHPMSDLPSVLHEEVMDQHCSREGLLC